MNKEATQQWTRVVPDEARPFSFSPVVEPAHDVLVIQPFAFPAETTAPTGRIVAVAPLTLAAPTTIHMPAPATNDAFVPVINSGGYRWRLNETAGMVPYPLYNGAAIANGDQLEFWSVGAAAICALTTAWTLTLGSLGGGATSLSPTQVSTDFIFE